MNHRWIYRATRPFENTCKPLMCTAKSYPTSPVICPRCVAIPGSLSGPRWLCIHEDIHYTTQKPSRVLVMHALKIPLGMEQKDWWIRTEEVTLIQVWKKEMRNVKWHEQLHRVLINRYIDHEALSNYEQLIQKPLCLLMSAHGWTLSKRRPLSEAHPTTSHLPMLPQIPPFNAVHLTLSCNEAGS